jgi:probable 2-oxoglutarate dehydrogenase E1 component DHKTD1
MRKAILRSCASSLGKRRYHDESFGFRKSRVSSIEDYTEAQLENRAKNAPLLRYVDSLRTHGHRAASLDPLDLLSREEVAALDPSRYGLTDPNSSYDVNGILWTSSNQKPWTLESITRHLRDIYVDRIAYEYMHSPSKEERLWFSHQLESVPPKESRTIPDEERKRLWQMLVRSEVLDRFLQVKFPNLKRYGLEGGESMIPALNALFEISAKAGVEQIVMGMPHRGRLNLLTDLLGYEPAALFHKIKGNSELPEGIEAEGDVLSHLFISSKLEYGGKSTKVSLLPNPSHLEAIDPVAMGKARAKQYSLLKTSPENCTLGDKVMCVQLHGDASFTGQGVIMESLGLSNLPHYTSGGSVHIVVNNNIGYTTPATSARSSLYCSDVGKMINAPILHVNGDYPEDVVRAVEVAFKYREAFRKDIIIDLMVYRRWGHNELDEPAFTQPQMYEKIRNRISVPQMYENKLTDDAILTKETIEQYRASHKSYLEGELAKTDSFKPKDTTLQGQWAGMVWPSSTTAVQENKVDWNPDTGVSESELTRVAKASVELPGKFQILSRLQRHIKSRLSSLESGQGINWATAEAMAFGSLMSEGYDVRISGQDVGRGTFSQRHAMFVDQQNESVVVPLNESLGSKSRLELANSSLSEVAVLGFEYGQSWERPDLLPIWEAQYGDFFNGAQIIIDTFISSGETKWLKQSGIVMLLPHGLDGAGPEHSSSRLERFLQLSSDRYEYDPSRPYANPNMHIVFPTTPAQFFHLLRRQMKRNFRKPLIVASPKGLLRHPAATSSLSEMSSGSSFQPVLADPAIQDSSSVDRLILVTGKLYYDLVKERAAKSLDSRVAIVRVEELSPFPFVEMKDTLSRFVEGKKDLDIAWVQEEPRNQGAWGHVGCRIENVLEGLDYQKRVRYVGRRESALPATGIGKMYAEQQKAVLANAFQGL